MEKNKSSEPALHNTIRVPTSLDNGDFFKWWLKFLTPFHGLSPTLLGVAAAFLKYRFNLGKVVKDEALLDRIVMSDDIKAKIKEELGLTKPHFQVIMTKLKTAKFIIDNKINPKFIPKKLEEGDKSLLLLLYFDLDSNVK